ISQGKKIRQAYNRGNIERLQAERDKLPNVKDIFASSNHVFLAYKHYDPKTDTTDTWLAAFTLEGTFIKEFPLPEKPGIHFAFDKTNDILYSLADKGTGNDKFYLLKYELAGLFDR
ncbi:MAG: hypothetical protein GY765_21450, partial [bacterium]|nr:hypothetical protein [bacterium]